MSKWQPRTAAVRLDHPGIPGEGSLAEPGARTARRGRLVRRPTGGSAPPSSAGPACWSPRSSAAAVSPVTASPTSRWSPSRSAGRWHPGHCIRSASCWPGSSKRPAEHEDTIESLVSGELGRVLGGLRTAPGRSTPLRPASHRHAHRVRLPHRRRQGPGRGRRRERRAAGGRRRRAARSASSWCRPTRPGVTVTTQKSVDMVKRYARVQFDGVEVDESAVVGTAEQTAGADRAAAPGRAGPAVRRDRRHPRRRARTSPPSGCSTGTASAGRWRPIRRSSTASPT